MSQLPIYCEGESILWYKGEPRAKQFRIHHHNGYWETSFIVFATMAAVLYVGATNCCEDFSSINHTLCSVHWTVFILPKQNKKIAKGTTDPGVDCFNQSAYFAYSASFTYFSILHIQAIASFGSFYKLLPALTAVTSCRQLWQLLQAVDSLDSFYKLSTASKAVTSCCQLWQLLLAVVSFDCCYQLWLLLYVGASFDSCYQLSPA